MAEKRFILDDCGTLIDMQTRDTFDYVSEVVECLNKLHEENKRLQGRIQEYEEIIGGYIDENEEIRKKVNALHEENEKLNDENEQLKEELDYYKNKCASLETGLIQVERTNLKLQEENQILRQNLLAKDIEWIRNNTAWEQMPTNRKTYIRTDKND